MINENKSSCYPETDIYKQGVCSPYKELENIKSKDRHEKTTIINYYHFNISWMQD